MNISRSEAYDLFKKWNAERTLLHCTFKSEIPNDFACIGSILGRVAGLTERYVLIDASTLNNRVGKNFSLQLSLNSQRYEFADARGVFEKARDSFNAHYETVLVVVTLTGIICEILALKPTSEIT